MLVKKSKEQREYLLKLKKDITDFLENFKKRYQLFPWTEINKIKKVELMSSTPIVVNGVKFTTMELLKEIQTTKTKIQGKLRPSYYNFILRAYIKDSMNKEKNDLSKIYDIYKEQLDISFKGTKDDLAFCLSALKALNKTLKDTNVNESMNEIFEESTHKTNFFRKLYHVSQENLNGKVLHPRVPHNRLTEADLEEGITARVCFSNSIDGCLMALSQNLKDRDLYVHIPVDKTEYQDVFKHKVADAKVTKEKWVTCDVELKCIGKIHVISAQDKKYKFDFRDVNKEACKKAEMNPINWTYKWNWEWVDKYTTESESPKSIFFNDFKKFIKDNNMKEVSVLGNIKTHENKKKKETWLLLGTVSSDKDGSYKPLCNKLSKNIKYDGESIEFHTAYFPGDVFVYVVEPKVVSESRDVNLLEESEDIEMRDTFLNDAYEKVDVNDFLLECAVSLLEEDTYDDDVTTEGVNLDARKIFKDSKKKYKIRMKSIKQSMKDAEYDSALREADGLLKDLEEAERQLSKLDSTIGSVVFSVFTTWTLQFLRSLALCLVPFAGPVISNIWNLIEDWKKPVVKIVKSDGVELDDFNLYKNVIETRFTSMKKLVKNVITKIKEQQRVYEQTQKKAQKEASVTKESADFLEAKKNLYDACARGEITIEEREELFLDLQDKYFIKESVDFNTVEEGVSKSEKFNQVKSELYSRCNSGLISVEERESLITKAYDMIFTETEDIEKEADGIDSKELDKNINDAIKDNGSEIEKSIDNATK